MARYKGKDGHATAGGSVIGERVSFDVTITTTELDANTQGSDWTDVDGGQKSAAGTIEVFRDPADAGQTALAVNDTVALVLQPEGTDAGLTEISGNFLVTEKGITSAVGDLVKTSYSVRNKGAVTETTIT